LLHRTRPVARPRWCNFRSTPRPARPPRVPRWLPPPVACRAHLFALGLPLLHLDACHSPPGRPKPPLDWLPPRQLSHPCSVPGPPTSGQRCLPGRPLFEAATTLVPACHAPHALAATIESTPHRATWTRWSDRSSLFPSTLVRLYLKPCPNVFHPAPLIANFDANKPLSPSSFPPLLRPLVTACSGHALFFSAGSGAPQTPEQARRADQSSSQPPVSAATISSILATTVHQC
jgi:hypothetical protein